MLPVNRVEFAYRTCERLERIAEVVCDSIGIPDGLTSTSRTFTGTNRVSLRIRWRVRRVFQVSPREPKLELGAAERGNNQK